MMTISNVELTINDGDSVSHTYEPTWKKVLFNNDIIMLIREFKYNLLLY